MNRRIGKHIISGKSTIKETLTALNELSGDSMTLFALEEDGKLIGSVTDGDIRRALINGHTIEDTAGDIAFRKFISLTSDASPEERYNTLARARKRQNKILTMKNDGILT
ncbi:MAG: hypothetical protein K2J46_03460, partial [Muribaculaceae bacterium]|nr:hypothetical protein [Muribaculaceae bacterium]